MKSWNQNNKHLFHSWSFGKINYNIFAIGLLVIILGYIIMGTGETESIQATKLSPIILIIGYCVIIPAAILVKQREKD